VSAKYVLRSYAFSQPQTINGAGADAEEVFARSIKRLGITAEEVYSFWRVGESIQQVSKINEYQSVTMWDRGPGDELIFELRGLPVLGNDARAILAGRFMSPKTTLVLNNQEKGLTERSRVAFDELIAAGLLSEEPADNGYAEARRYALTEAGRLYPRAAPFEFMARHGNFKIVEPISDREIESETSFEP
jgi:hypothetical protein